MKKLKPQIIKVPENKKNVLIKTDKFSNVEILHFINGGGAEIFQEIKIIVGESSNVKYTFVENAGTKNIVINRSVEVLQNGVFECNDFIFGGLNCKLESNVYLKGRGAVAKSDGIFFASGSQTFNIKRNVEHTVGATKSYTYFNGAVGGSAKVGINDIIKIDVGATKCYANESISAIILNDDASINPVPSLEILNDDVKCGHSVAISNVNAEKLFYLMSRGMNQKDATKIIVEGFLGAQTQKIIKQLISKKIYA